MNNWHEYKNYMRRRNPDVTYTYIIIVYGKNVEVSEQIYNEYAKGVNKMKYMELDLKHDRVRQDAKGKAKRDTNGVVITLPARVPVVMAALPCRCPFRVTDGMFSGVLPIQFLMRVKFITLSYRVALVTTLVPLFFLFFEKIFQLFENFSFLPIDT